MNPREKALKILVGIEKNDEYLTPNLNSISACDMSDSDKNLAYEIVMGCLKNYLLLERIIMCFSLVKIKKMSVYVDNGAYV